jgi:hypothetical protein
LPPTLLSLSSLPCYFPFHPSTCLPIQHPIDQKADTLGTTPILCS